MSETIATGSLSVPKRTCTKCSRTVLLARVEGRLVEVEPSRISVVTNASIATQSAKVQPARQLHADNCLIYQLENERKANRAKWAGPPTRKAVGASRRK